VTQLLKPTLSAAAPEECGWADVAVAYACSGRIPGTGRHWPRWLSRWFPCAVSDNVLIIGRRPADGLGPAIDRADDR